MVGSWHGESPHPCFKYAACAVLLLNSLTFANPSFLSSLLIARSCFSFVDLFCLAVSTFVFQLASLYLDMSSTCRRLRDPDERDKKTKSTDPDEGFTRDCLGHSSNNDRQLLRPLTMRAPVHTRRGNELADKAVFTFISALTAVNAIEAGHRVDFEKHRSNFESVARQVFHKHHLGRIEPTDFDAQREDVRRSVRSNCLTVLRSCANGGYNETTKLLLISPFVQQHVASVLRDGTPLTRKPYQPAPTVSVVQCSE